MLKTFFAAAVAAAIFTSSTAFATGKIELRSIDSLLANKKSFVYSPASLRSALNLILPGAKGTTQSELRSLLMSSEYIIASPDVISSANQNGFELHSVQKVWAEKTLNVLPIYQQTLKKDFNTSIELADFSKDPEGERVKINSWVAKETRDRIMDLIPRGILNGAKMVLVNAIYFLAEWEVPFTKESTFLESFKNLQGLDKKIPVMHKTFDKIKYFENADLQSIALKYKGNDIYFIVVLPKRGDAAAVLKTAFDLNVTNYKDEEVTVSLPKFETQFTIDFKDIRKQLFIENIFSDDADFSGISSTPLKVSNIIQKAFIKVDEKGTEAAAATAIIMPKGIGSKISKAKVFNANHSFLYMIQKNSKNLFVGLFNN